MCNFRIPIHTFTQKIKMIKCFRITHVLMNLRSLMALMCKELCHLHLQVYRLSYYQLVHSILGIWICNIPRLSAHPYHCHEKHTDENVITKSKEYHVCVPLLNKNNLRGQCVENQLEVRMSSKSGSDGNKLPNKKSWISDVFS